jgi:calcium-dependent protein kinase
MHFTNKNTNKNTPSLRDRLFSCRKRFRPGALSASQRLRASYKLTSKILGIGFYGKVYVAICKETGAQVAVKIINKRRLNRYALNNLFREVQVLQAVNHPHIVRLLETFEDKQELHLVMERVNGCDLFDRISKDGRLTEKVAKTAMRAIFETLNYLHQRRVVHRDIKPENLMVFNDPKTKDALDVKFIDFGLSKTFAWEPGHGEAIYKRGTFKRMKSKVGTPSYMAPEIIKGKPYDSSVDIWSAGVVMFIMLAGFPPFNGETDSEIFREVLHAKVDFSDKVFDSISDDAKDLICALLRPRPSQRLSPSDALDHDFFGNKRTQCVGKKLYV